MDLAHRRWSIAASLALLAAALLSLAAFLPLFHVETGSAPVEQSMLERITVTSWGSERTIGDLEPRREAAGFTTGYQQLLGAALALAAGLLAAVAARTGSHGNKGSLMLLIASGAFNTGVVSILGALLASYFNLYPPYDGPDGRTVASLGLGAWLMFTGAFLTLAATIAVLLRKQQTPAAESSSTTTQHPAATGDSSALSPK